MSLSRHSPLHLLHHTRKASHLFRPPRSTPRNLTPTPSPSNPPTALRTWQPLLRSLSTILLWAPALYFTHTHIFQITSIIGPSMSPFLNPSPNTTTSRDHVLLTLYSPTETLHRGTIIAFRSPNHPEKLVVKRIVALPGDVVRTRKPYVRVEEEVPVGHVWVEGDGEEGKTWDSNFYGPVSQSLIVGRVRAVVWPWGNRGLVRWEDWRGDGRVREGTGEGKEVEFF